MRLFEIDDNHQVRPNREFIGLIPEFKALLVGDKGSKGDSDGRRKLKARAQLAYIYFLVDFGSPLRDWEPIEKEREARNYAGLSEEDAKDKDLQLAIAKYTELQYKNARSLRTFDRMKLGLDKLDDYLGDVDLTTTDKKGELVHDADKYRKTMEGMTSLYDKFHAFEKYVEEDLKKSESTIQGNRTLGDQELRRNPTMKSWSEEDIKNGSAHRAGFDPEAAVISSGGTFADLQKQIISKKVDLFTKEELDSVDDD